MPREGGASSNRGGRHSIVCVGGYWIIRLREGFAKVTHGDSFGERFAGG
jgi:hypothetical protein